MPLDVDSMTFPELVAAAAALNDQITAKIAAYNDWAAGSATGGPEGDGRYPLPVLGDPGEVLLPGPARLAADVRPVGLFGEIATKHISPDIDVIETTGQDQVGRGRKALARTTTTGETAWRTQSADGAWWEQIENLPALWDFGYSNTDNGAIWDQMMAWSTGNGRTGFVPPALFKFVDVRSIAKNAIIQGCGRDGVLQGPGFKCWGSAVDGGGLVTYENINVTVRDVLFDGEAHVTSGRALDFLGGNFVTVEGCRFQGFKDQIVLDVIQRAKIHRNQFNASVGTRSGVWIPRGTEAHTGVDLALHPTNIVSICYNHFSWFNSTGWGIVDHGGLQHEIKQNQSSFGRAHLRLGGVSGIEIGNNDWEFSTTWSMETVNTNLDGVALATTANIINLTPGGYFDKPMNIQHARGLVVTGTDFFISGQAAIQGCAGLRSIRSIGNKNNRTGGTILDAMPGLSGASIFQFDEENFLPVVKINPADFAAPLSISDTVSGVLGKVTAPAGSQRWEASRNGAVTSNWSWVDGYFRPGSQNGLGPRVYGNAVSPATTNPPGSTPGNSFCFRPLATGETYVGQSLLYVKDNGGAWREHGRPQAFTYAEALDLPVVQNATIFISDRSNRPAYGDGNGVAMSAGTGSARWRWFADDAVIS